jgi:hypothetical protein
MTYRVLFGMRAGEQRLAFHPMVPPAYAGERTLRGVRYRRAVLTVTVRGYGTGVARAWLDGRAVPRAEVPASLTGAHTLLVELDGRWPTSAITLVDARVAPATPVAALGAADTELRLEWPSVAGAARYVVHSDGRPIDTVRTTAVPVAARAVLAEYQVQALDSAGVASFLSEPVRAIAGGAEQLLRPPGSGEGALRLERGNPARVVFAMTVRRGGRFAIDARYANGSGPINTEDKAAVRTLRVDGREAGVLVMPQRGAGRWDDWGYSNPLVVSLRPGRHVLSLEWTPLDENMNRRVSTALLEHLRVTPLR